ncbi:3512_t:CDS:2, partial [Scutellospora calospora]
MDLLVNKTTRCCCCIPLRSGVITITLIYVVGSTFSAITDILSLMRNKSNDNSVTIADLVINSLFFPVFIFGFVICCFTKSAYHLRIFAIFFIIYTLVSIIELIFGVSKNVTVNECSELLVTDGSSIHDTVGFCEDNYDKYEALYIVGYTLTIFIMIHFALVVSAYAAKCKAEEDRSKQEMSETN